MGSLIGLGVGLGLFCCWWACWQPSAETGRVTSQRAAWLIDDLHQAGLAGVRPSVFALCCLVCALTVGVVGYLICQSPPIASCFAILAGWAPLAGVRLRARQRRVVLRDLWPEAVDNLVSGIRAGLSLPEALAQLSERGPEPLRPSFAAFAEDHRATGRFAECLDRLKADLADPVGDRIIEALRLTREVGGNDLGNLLRTLSTFLREDARTRAELEARQSWTVNAARLAVAAPWVVLAMLATRPEAVTAYNRPAGVLVLAIGAAVSVIAYRVMMVIGRLPEEGRVLR